MLFVALDYSIKQQNAVQGRNCSKNKVQISPYPFTGRSSMSLSQSFFVNFDQREKSHKLLTLRALLRLFVIARVSFAERNSSNPIIFKIITLDKGCQQDTYGQSTGYLRDTYAFLPKTQNLEPNSYTVSIKLFSVLLKTSNPKKKTRTVMPTV